MPCLLFFAFCFLPPSSLCVSCSVHLSHFVILQRPRHGSSWPGSPRRRMPRRPANSRDCRPHHLAAAIFFPEVCRRAPASSASRTRPAPSPARSPACVDHAPRLHAPGPHPAPAAQLPSASPRPSLRPAACLHLLTDGLKPMVSSPAQCPLLYTFGPARFGPCTFFFRSANLSIYPESAVLQKNP